MHPTKITLCATLLASALVFSPGFVRPAFAQGASLSSATDEQKAAAGKAFEAGIKKAKAKKHEDALQAFRDSYAAVASPNSHLMVARELVELGKLEEAFAEYEATIAEAQTAMSTDPKYEAALKSATNEQNELKKKVYVVHLAVSGQAADSKVTVGGRDIPESDWQKPIALSPGSSVTIELSSGSAPVATQTVEPTAGGESTVELAPPAAAPPPGPTPETTSAEGHVSTSGGGPSMRTWAYIAGGVGAAGLITFGVFGIMANSKHSELEDKCKDGVCPKDLQDTKDAGKRDQTIANIGLVVGVVGLGTGTVLYLMSNKKQEKPAAKVRSFRPSVSVGYRSVTVSGEF